MADPGASRDGRSGNATGESGGVAYHARHLVLPHDPAHRRLMQTLMRSTLSTPLPGPSATPPLPPESSPSSPRGRPLPGGWAEDAVRHRQSLPAAGNARSAPRDGTMAPCVHRRGHRRDGDGDVERGRRGAERIAPHHLRGACLSRSRVARERCRSGGRPGCCRPRWALRCRSARQGVVVPATAWAAEWRKVRPSWDEGAASLAGRSGRQAGPACGRTQAGLRHAASWTGSRRAERRAHDEWERGHGPAAQAGDRTG